MSESVSSIDGLVAGPFSVTDRRLTVDEASYAVIFHNGAAWGVRSAGRSGGWTRLFSDDRSLPVIGQVSYLTFRTSPFIFTAIERGFRLADGSRVDVQARLQVEPVWRADPSQLMDVARTYGPHHREYVSAARHSLQADFRSLLRAAAGELDHQYIHSVSDSRDILRSTKGRSVVQIAQVIDIEFSNDETVVQMEELQRQFAVAAAQTQYDVQMLNLTSALEVARANLDQSLARSTALSTAETHRLAGDLYGVPAWALAHPSDYNAAAARRDGLLASLLTEYADVIPFLAESVGGTAHDVLRLVAGIDAAPASGLDAPNGTRRAPTVSETSSIPALPPTSRPRWTTDRRISEAISDYLADGVEVVGSAAGPGGNRSAEVAIVVTDGPSGQDGTSRMSLASGDLTLVCVSDTPEKSDVVVSALGNIGVLTGHRFDVEIRDDGSARSVVITAVHNMGDPAPDAVNQLGAWLSTLTTLLDNTYPTLRLEV